MKKVRHTVDQLRQLLSYDPVAGTLVRNDTGAVINPARDPKGPRFDLEGRRYYARAVVVALLTNRWPKLGEIKTIDGDLYNLRAANFILVPPDEKRCSSCKVIKPMDMFCKDSSRPDGKDNKCKACQKAEYTKTYGPKAYGKAIAKKYGLGEQAYETLLAAQGGKCAICKHPKKLVVDHCRSTNKVRGLLCHNCNTLLGHARDSIDVLHAAIQYLQR